MPGITIPPDALSVTINAQGQVQVTSARPGRAAERWVRCSSCIFPTRRPAGDGRQSVHRNPGVRFGTSTRPPGSPGYGTLQQGYLETSNVNAVEEITTLITAQRAYEMNSKVIQTTDQMMATLSNTR